MTGQEQGDNPGPQGQSNGRPRTEADLAQAYKEIMRGEQAATAMENNLSNLESKLDALLAAFDGSEVARATGEDIPSTGDDGVAQADKVHKPDAEPPSGPHEQAKKK